MTRLQAAIGGLLVAPVIVLSIAFGAPEILSLPPSATAPAQAVAETKIEVPMSPETEGVLDRTVVKTISLKKLAAAAPTAVALPEVPPAATGAAPAPVVAASSCERYLFPVALAKPDGLLDRMFDTKAEETVAQLNKRIVLARNCLRTGRINDGR